MKIILFGAGHVGLAIAKQFSEAPEIKQIMVCDRRGLALEHINEKLPSSKIRTHRIGLEQETVIKSILKGFNIVINALPHQFGPKLAKLALQSGLHYIDLGGTQFTYDKQSALADLAKEKKKLLLPNTGFSPGLLNIIAIHEAEQYDEVENLTLRSGCLPTSPSEPFNYKLVIAADALLSEYVDPQLQIKNHTIVEEPSLSGLEPLEFKGFNSPLPLEAFHTGNRINSLVVYSI
jgi:lysine 6-dehydrogenase